MLEEVLEKAPYARCFECPLQSQPCALTQTPPQPKAAIVSRSPGYYEALSGRPFSGPSGEVLDFLLKENGVSREEVMVTNTVLCSTAKNQGKVPPEAIKACAPRLAAELEGCKLVIACGSEAVNLLIGRGAIERYRGYRIIQEHNGSERIVVASNNPALVLRDDSTFPNLRRDFKRAFHPLPPPTYPTVEVIEDGRAARDFITSLRRHSNRVIAADLETRGGLSHKATIVSMQFSIDGTNSIVLGERDQLWEDEDFLGAYLRPFFESPNYTFVWHNGVFDTKILRQGYGIQARVDQDTLLLNYACDERGGVHALEYCLMEEFGWDNYEPASVKEFKKDGIVRDYDELYTYAGWDAAGTFQLFETLTERLSREGSERSYRNLLLPGIAATREMETIGFRYDVDAAADLMENEVGPEIKDKERNLQKLIDKPLYNPRSTTQNSILFYDEWKVKHEMQKRPDMERSVDKAALNEIVAGRFSTRLIQEKPKIIRFAKELKRFRELTKQADTYIVGMIERAIKDPEHRIYTDILLHGTTSGRPSSRDPNLLNITRTKEGLPDIRKFFLPSEGRLIVAADFSQAELRTIAWLSQDEQLMEVYNKGIDLHSYAAEHFFGPNFVPEQRNIAKNCNFGVFYGQSADSFQEKHNVPKAIAERYIQWCWQNFTGVREWKNEIIKEMRTGRVTTPFGRVRRFHLLTKENFNTAVREAVNFKPQSIAADFTLRAVILLQGTDGASPEIDLKKASLLLTVYDSILADVEESYVDEYTTICKEVMESRPKEELGWTIPFTAEAGAGRTWADAK